MLKQMRAPLGIAAVFVAAVGCTEPAANTAARAEARFTQCSPCHGEQGEGNHAQLAPPIAGLPAWYVEAQLLKYKQDIRGNHFDDLPGLRMRPMAWALEDAEVKEMASYVSTLPTPGPQAASIDGYAPRGAQAFAVCTACHLADGSGQQALNAPPIAGQADWYVYEQLKKFKHGMRGADPRDVTGGQMRAIALGLGDDKALQDIARYVAELPVKRPH